jgi:hypothetical protein
MVRGVVVDHLSRCERCPGNSRQRCPEFRRGPRYQAESGQICGLLMIPRPDPAGRNQMGNQAGESLGALRSRVLRRHRDDVRLCDRHKVAILGVDGGMTRKPARREAALVTDSARASILRTPSGLSIWLSGGTRWGKIKLPRCCGHMASTCVPTVREM